MGLLIMLRLGPAEELTRKAAHGADKVVQRRLWLFD
jgi:hypothetical protein